MSNRFKKGEIATILTIVTVIFLGAATLISTVFLKDQQKQTTTTKATDTDSGYHGPCVAPYPPISQDTKYTPTGYRWVANCNLSCTDNSKCPKSTDIGAVNPDTSNWCYGFSDGHKCMMLEKIPGAPIYTCPDGGIPKGNGDCEYGKDALHSDFYVEQGTGKCGSCILVLYSGGFPYGSCRYSNADVCRPSDYQGGCRGVCNRNCCNSADTIKLSGDDYEKLNWAGKSSLPPGGANPTIPGSGVKPTQPPPTQPQPTQPGQPANPTPTRPVATPTTVFQSDQCCYTGYLGELSCDKCRVDPPCGSGGTLIPCSLQPTLPDNCVPKVLCDNFAYTLNLGGGNFQCHQCYSDPSKYLLVNLSSTSPTSTLTQPTATPTPEPGCYYQDEKQCFGVEQAACVRCENGKYKKKETSSVNVTSSPQVSTPTPTPSQTCFITKEQKIGDSFTDKAGKDLPCGTEKIAGSTTLNGKSIVIYRLCSTSNICQYECILENGDRYNCWGSQRAVQDHTWVTVRNLQDRPITIIKLRVIKTGMFGQVQSSYTTTPNSILVDKDHPQLFDLSKESVDCPTINVPVVGADLKIFITYINSKNLEKTVSSFFPCEMDFSAIINIGP